MVHLGISKGPLFLDRCVRADQLGHSDSFPVRLQLSVMELLFLANVSFASQTTKPILAGQPGVWG